MSSIFAAVEWPFGIAAGTAVGSAVAGGITPGVQSIINEANAAHAVKPPAYQLLAQGVAQGQVDRQWATDRAAESGIGNDAFGRLIDIADVGPGASYAFELWRRNLIDDAGFGRALKRQAIEDEWINPLRALKQRLLSPAELANARQQEFIDDGRLHSEGDLQGYDAERMDLMFKMAGLPPGVMDGLTMLRRGIIDEPTYRQLVAEGHTKTKYTDDLLGLRHHIISGHEAAGLRLRGWLSAADAAAHGELDGWDAAAMELLYLNRGRPATVRQTVIGYRRGASLPGFVGDESGAVGRAVTESDLRPEWKGILEAAVPTYPSLFQLNRLVAAGAITADIAADWAFKQGMAEEVVAVLKAYWSQPAAAGASSLLKKAQDRLYTTAHAEFMDGELPDTAAVAALERIGASSTEANAVVDVWTYERAIFRKDLTQAQVLKFYRRSEWSRVQAYDWLTARGMSGDDADALLQSV